MERDLAEPDRRRDRHREVGQPEYRRLLGQRPERPGDPGHPDERERAGDGDRPELAAGHLDVAGRDRPDERDERSDERAGQDGDEGDDRVADRQGETERAERAEQGRGQVALPGRGQARRSTITVPVAQPRARKRRPNSVVSSRPGPTASRSPGTIARARIVAAKRPSRPISSDRRR